MMRTLGTKLVWGTMLTAAMLAGSADAQGKADPFASKPALTTQKDGPLQVAVLQVQGTVQAHRPTDNPWIDVKPGMFLPQGTKLSTSFASSAVLLLEGRTEMHIGPLTLLKLEQHFKEKAQLTTRMHVELGQLRLDIPGVAGLRTDLEVSSPRATAAVRGTKFLLITDDLRDRFVVTEGDTVYTNKDGEEIPVSAGEETNDRLWSNVMVLQDAQEAPILPYGVTPEEEEGALASGDNGPTPVWEATDSTSDPSFGRVEFGSTSGSEEAVFKPVEPAFDSFTKEELLLLDSSSPVLVAPAEFEPLPPLSVVP